VIIYIHKEGDSMYKPRVEKCSDRIRKAMQIRGMKATELCKLAKVPKSSLSLYLSDAYEPKQDRIYAIASVLNVSEAWLIGYDVPMEKQPNLNLKLFAEPTVDIKTSDLTEGEIAMIKVLDKLTDDEQKKVIEYVEFLISKRGK
jgi:transcriptional regulator with XRE-family HTH domain